MAKISDFAKMNIMAGTARSLETAPTTQDDNDVWNRDFDLLVDDLSKLADPELGADLASEKDWYTSAFQVAKGYFNNKPFGGMKPATGQYGFRLLGPQDLCTSATSDTPAFYSWVQTVTTTSAKSYANYALGYSAGDVYAQNSSEKRAVIAFHRLLSYKPSPKIILVEFNVNNYPYAPYNVEVFSKIGKVDKLFRIIPMPGRVLLHPGGQFHVNLYFDRETGATVPSGTANVDIEVAPFGLVFGEYDYLAAANLV
ncbi:MAG: hypothetical protein Q7T57_02780 [Dehalococcoidales bacterium]|nr:hypothetical protein [Dehalococcoidales bacterium]